MNKQTKSFLIDIAVSGAVAAGGLVIAGITSLINKKRAQAEASIADKTLESIKENRSVEVKSLIDEYETLTNYVSEANKLENDELTRRNNAFKASINYDEKTTAIRNTAANKIDSYKKTTGFDAAIKDITERCDTELSDFRDAHDMDDTIESLKHDISEARRKYDHELASISSVCEADTVAMVKSDLKSKRDCVVEDAEKKIKDLEKKFEDFSKETKSKYKKEEATLRKNLSSFCDEVYASRDEQIRELDTLVAENSNINVNTILGERSEDDITKRSRLTELSSEVAKIEQETEAAFNKASNEYDSYDIWAEMFKMSGISKAGVWGLGMIPVIPACYVAFRYFRCLARITSKM